MNIFQENTKYENPFVISQNKNNQLQLFDSEEAFMLGNLFKNLYTSYHGFSNYCLQPQSKRQQMLLKVQMYDFVAHEINLFLDTHPNNKEMIKLYKKYSTQAKQARISYEKEYGPLFVQNCEDIIPFQWVKDPWPWEYQN